MSEPPDVTGSQPVPPQDPDEALAAFLLAYDAALALGVSPPNPTPRPDGTPDAEVQARVARARQFLNRLHRNWPWPGAPGTDAAGSLADLGLSLGRYELRGVLGRGGHGIVFLAYDTTLKRQVALKVPRPEALASADLRRRFLREGEAVARLEHPGIVPVFDLGQAGPVCYLASAHVAGPNLSDWLARRGSPVDPRAAARLTLAMAEAVAHAHGRGVIHRDLKPSNVLLAGADDPSADPETFSPQITDFGLAKLFGGEGDETRTGGGALGTPRYMAPEQAAGSGDRVEPRTDLYGLGAILHVLLSGEPPEGPARSASGVLPGRADVPADLRSIVARCLRADPADRYDTAGDLAEDLRRFLRGAPVLAREQRRRRVRAAWFLGATVALAAVATAWRGAPWRPPATAGPVNLLVHALRHERGEVYHVRYSHDGRWVASSGQDWTIRVWDAATGAPTAVLRHRQEVNWVDWSPDDRLVAGACDDGTVWVWDVAAQKPVCEPIPAHAPRAAVCVLFRPDGRRLVTGGSDQKLRLLHWQTGERLAETPLEAAVESMALTESGEHLAVGMSSYGLVKMFDAGLTEVRRWSIPLDHGFPQYMRVRGVAIRTGAAAAVGRSNHVFLCNYAGFVRMTNETHGGEVFSVAISPDGRYIASAGDSADPSVRFWDGGEMDLRAAFRAHDRQIWCIAYAPDGQRLATASQDGTVKLWDAPEAVRPR